MKSLLFKTALITSLAILAANCLKEEPILVEEAVDGNTSGPITFRDASLPQGWNHTDIGPAGGGADFGSCSAPAIMVNSRGFSSPYSDLTHFAYTQKCGDFEFVARVSSIDNSGFAGIMIREDGSPGSRKVALKTQLSTIIRRDVRTTPNGMTQSAQLFRPGATWLKLVRSGNTIQGYTSQNGQNWQFATGLTMALPDCVLAGLYTESINGNTTTTGGFAGVDLDFPEICGDGIDNNCNGQVDECCMTDAFLRVTIDPDGIPGNADDYTIYMHPTLNATDIEWGGHGIDIPGLPNANFNYDGESYTQAIVAELGEGHYAAKVCADLIAFGCDDWYLPAIGELWAFFFAHGQFSNHLWSSTESSSTHAWNLLSSIGSTGQASNRPKNSTLTNCRCVRKE
jgi:hypothetical protein